MDLVGAFSGILFVMTTFINFIVAPIAEHLFKLKAIQKLYLVRTNDDYLFVTNDKNKKVSNFHKKKNLQL